MNDTLTIRDAVDLAAIIEAAQRGSKVRWLSPEDAVLEGVARSIGTAEGSFHDGDVRDAYLRVSLWTADHYLPVRNVMEMYRAGEFAVEVGA